MLVGMIRVVELPQIQGDHSEVPKDSSELRIITVLDACGNGDCLLHEATRGHEVHPDRIRIAEISQRRNSHGIGGRHVCQQVGSLAQRRNLFLSLRGIAKQSLAASYPPMSAKR